MQRFIGRSRLAAIAALLVATATAAVGTTGQTAALAATYANPDFYDETYVSGLSGPVQLEWLPGGRLLVAQQSGVVRLIDNGSLRPAPFVDISDQVNGIRDRGLLGIAAHPDWPTQPYLYLLFTYDPPETAGQGGRAGPNGKGARVSRLIRVTADSSTGYTTAVPGSDLILMGSNSTAANIGNLGAAMNDFSQTTCAEPDGTPIRDCLPADSESHTIGSVRFGDDGYLYVSNGDAASYTQVDSRALRSLDLDSMAGKIFRIDPATGRGISDNPFYTGDADANRSKVWISGLRNPFRFTLDPNDGEPWIGDVGWGAWEEINHGARGADFGWPCYEGGSGTSNQQPSYAGLSECSAYYAGGAPTPADHAWYRAGQGGAALAGPVYTGLAYPAEYRNALFFGDYAQGWIKYSPTDGAGNLLTDGSGNPIVNTFATGVGPFVDISQGPDGSLYYVDIIGGSIKRIVYSGVVTGPQLDYKYYEGTWGALPDFTTLTPTTSGMTSSFDLAVRERDDNFALRFTGCVNAPASGSYTFSTTSDDGSRLYVDGSLIVDNDGVHGPATVSGSTTLEAGNHALAVTYFEQIGGQELSATWSGPGFGTQNIAPTSVTACDAQLTGSSSLDFGEADEGSSKSLPLTVSNSSGPDPLEISSIISSDPTVFSTGPGLPTVLAPGESLAFDVTFSPQTTGPVSGSLTVTHSGTNDPKTISVAGTGVAPSNTPPSIEIVSPLDGATYDLGSTVPLVADATDPEDGTPLVTWTGILHHGTDHIHPNEFNESGTEASFVLNDHDDNAWIEVCATATDSQDATATECVDVYPTLVEYTFDTVPSGLEVTYHSHEMTTPFTVSTPVGAVRSITAPTSQSGLEFVSWSIGGPATQTITIGDTAATLTARYQLPQVDPPAIENPGSQANRVGDQVALRISAHDPDGGAVTFAAAGLPPGLVANATTGEITGTPTAAGQYGVTIQVTDEESDSAETTFVWTIKAQLVAPVDVANSIYFDDIMWLLDREITFGCNPPRNDRYCPGDSVTRGQMAAFLARFLGLTDDGGGNAFTDDDGSVFAGDIDKLATAGITAGCDPSGTRFCPNDPITRGQMAALLVRALGLADAGGGDLFADDDGSIFENDIDKLATAGITRGCNPPANTDFCPSDFVTRGQMAAFLRRAWETASL